MLVSRPLRLELPVVLSFVVVAGVAYAACSGDVDCALSREDCSSSASTGGDGGQGGDGGGGTTAMTSTVDTGAA